MRNGHLSPIVARRACTAIFCPFSKKRQKWKNNLCSRRKQKKVPFRYRSSKRHFYGPLMDEDWALCVARNVCIVSGSRGIHYTLREEKSLFALSLSSVVLLQSLVLTYFNANCNRKSRGIYFPIQPSKSSLKIYILGPKHARESSKAACNVQVSDRTELPDCDKTKFHAERSSCTLSECKQHEMPV